MTSSISRALEGLETIDCNMYSKNVLSFGGEEACKPKSYWFNV